MIIVTYRPMLTIYPGWYGPDIYSLRFSAGQHGVLASAYKVSASKYVWYGDHVSLNDYPSVYEGGKVGLFAS